jgi:4-hydroxybenzoate polyprenyltransferase
VSRRAATWLCFIVPTLLAFGLGRAGTEFLGIWSVLITTPAAAWLGWWSGSKVLRRVRDVERDTSDAPNS